jgi:hypothetical protein
MSAGPAIHKPYTHEGGSIINEKEITYLKARHPDHHCEYAKETLYPSPTFPPIKPTQPSIQPAKPEPQLDPAARAALAAAPSEVRMLSGNIYQSFMGEKIEKKLGGNPLFNVKGRFLGGGGSARTEVVYWSDLDKPRAEALAEILLSEGLSSTIFWLSGDGSKSPGHLQIHFGKDASEKGEQISRSTEPKAEKVQPEILSDVKVTTTAISEATPSSPLALPSVKRTISAGTRVEIIFYGATMPTGERLPQIRVVDGWLKGTTMSISLTDLMSLRDK